MEDSYTPVPWVYREVIAEEIEKNTTGKIFYFSEEGISTVEGRIVALEEIDKLGMFIRLEPEFLVRIDKIITLFGKPGAGYDQYDSYANACLSCTGGYED